MAQFIPPAPPFDGRNDFSDGDSVDDEIVVAPSSDKTVDSEDIVGPNASDTSPQIPTDSGDFRLSSAELHELHDLLDRHEIGVDEDEERLYLFDLYNRLQNGETISGKEMNELNRFKSSCKQEGEDGNKSRDPRNRSQANEDCGQDHSNEIVKTEDDESDSKTPNGKRNNNQKIRKFLKNTLLSPKKDKQLQSPPNHLMYQAFSDDDCIFKCDDEDGKSNDSYGPYNIALDSTHKDCGSQDGINDFDSISENGSFSSKHLIQEDLSSTMHEKEITSAIPSIVSSNSSPPSAMKEIRTLVSGRSLSNNKSDNSCNAMPTSSAPTAPISSTQCLPKHTVKDDRPSDILTTLRGKDELSSKEDSSLDKKDEHVKRFGV